MDKEISLRKSSISAVIIMACTFLSRILGFFRIAVISAIFGASGRADVLNTVFTIPNNLRKLLAEGALSSAFIPVLSECIVREDNNGRAKIVVRNVLTFQLTILIPFSILCTVFAGPLIRIVLVEFSDPELTELAVQLFRYFIHYLLLISISALIMGVLNSHNSFFIPAITPIIFSVCVITSVLLLHRRMDVFSMAVGVLAGGLFQILFQTPKFKKLGYDFRIDFSFNSEDFKSIMRKWLPVVATASIFTINQQIAARFATGLTTGSASSLHYALVFFQLPFGIFSASITTVLFPRMSRQAAVKDIKGLEESIKYGLRSLAVFLVPSALMLMMMGKEIIAVALQRGAFYQENTLLTHQVLFAYAAGLYCVGAFNFFQRFFYSIGNFTVPFRLAVVVCAVDVVLSLYLKETFLGVIGLAAANTIAFTLGFLLMLIFVKKELPGLKGNAIWQTIGKVFLSIIPSGFLIYIFLIKTGDWWKRGSTFSSFGLLMLCAGAALFLMILMFYLFKVDIFIDIIKRRKKK